MARRNKRVNKNTGEAFSRANPHLEEAWSSSPVRPPRFVLYCVNHENDRRWVVNSYACYAIRKIFDALVGDNEIEPSPLDEKTVTFGEIDIKSDQLQAILDYQYTKAEEAWELPVPYPDNISRFLTGARMGREFDRAPGEPKPERVKKEKAPPKERIDRTGMVTVQTLAEEAGIDPRDARAALRKAKIDKPTGGWLGDEAWAKTIRPVLKAAVIELKKKGKK